ncbi:MAG: hypothetical protein HY056_05590 [Proteobacteria bacterium]|nr:hypothetical protein [Pseudomonadota bacterium]
MLKRRNDIAPATVAGSPAADMPAMLGLPFVAKSTIVGGARDLFDSTWRACQTRFTAIAAKRETIASADRAARAAVAELFATRALPMAATITLAVALGVVAGSLGAPALTKLALAPSAPAQIATLEEVTTLGDTIARLENEITSLKVGLDLANKSANTQIASVAERLERGERRLALARRRATRSSPVGACATFSTGSPWLRAASGCSKWSRAICCRAVAGSRPSNAATGAGSWSRAAALSRRAEAAFRLVAGVPFAFPSRDGKEILKLTLNFILFWH